MPKTQISRVSTSVVTLIVVAPFLYAADPAPANPPSTVTTSNDPAPASPPVSSNDPAPASPPVSQNDPAPASPPVSQNDPAPSSPPSSNNDAVPLIDLPTVQAASDPAPADAPRSSQSVADSLPAVPTTTESPATPVRTPFLGVGFRDPSTTVVTTLYVNSTAAQLGIRLGDNLVSINGTPVGNLQQIRQLLATLAIGDLATVTLTRDKIKTMSVGPLPLGASVK